MSSEPRDSSTRSAMKGYWYEVTDEQLLWWRSVPTLDKLRWLDEAREFLWSAMTPQAKEAMRRFREGSI